MRTLGLIAGNGDFPLEVAREAQQQGVHVYTCAIRGETAPDIGQWSHAVRWIQLGELGKAIDFFRKGEAQEAIFAGKITKTSLFRGDVKPDFTMLQALMTTRNHNDDSLLGAVAQQLEKAGIRVLNSTMFLQDALPTPGVLTKRAPATSEWDDIEFGWEIAKELGRLDIGQSVVVKDKAVLALEAIEGTDACIRRGAQLGSKKVVVIKVAKPQQDMRFDVPAIGLQTVRTLIKVEASVLAFEAGKTIFLQREAALHEANKHRVAIVATLGKRL